MRIRKYCPVHNSLYAFMDMCQAAAFMDEQAGVVKTVRDCSFIIVDLVNKPDWMVTNDSED